jgi:hypothetical protein
VRERGAAKSLLSGQNAAAGAPSSGVAPEAAGGLPSEGTDGGALYQANNDDSATTATSTLGVPAAANDNAPVVADDASLSDESTPEPELELEGANDNAPPEPTPATGTDS